MTYSDTHSATSSQGELFGNSHSDKPDGQTTGQCGQDHALVSLLVQPENSKEPMIQGIYGRTYIDSSVKLNQMSALENRLVVRLATLGSTESAMILRQKATPAGRRILRLVPSMRLTNGRDCGGMRWKTPKASQGGYEKQGNGSVIATLQGEMDPSKLPKDKWPSPTSSTGGPESGGTTGRKLVTHMVANWPTPVANPDNKTPKAHLAMKERMGGGRKTITDIQVAMKAESGRWKTPTTPNGGRKITEKQLLTGKRDNGTKAQIALTNEMEATGATTGSNATTEKRGAPNPAFAFWLMGFSYPWMLSVARALQTYKKPSRKTASKRGE